MGVRVLHAFLRVACAAVAVVLGVPSVYPSFKANEYTNNREESERSNDYERRGMQQSQEYLSLAQLRPIALIPLIAIGLSHTRKENKHQ